MGEEPKKVNNLITIVVCCGLVQMFAFLGEGEADPFIAGEAENWTILQTTGTLAVLIQIVVFIPCYIFQTEKFYDLTGSITYILCSTYSLVAGARASAINSQSGDMFEFSLKAVVGTCLTLIWCTRLGYFLFRRVLIVGEDSRFDVYKPYPLAFLQVWCLQGLWTFLTAYCVFIMSADQFEDRDQDLGISEIVGIAVWIIGFGIEALADNQKNKWRKIKNDGFADHDFIDYGLWKYSRHPNYFGEMTLWWGIFILSLSSLQDKQFISIISPIFVFVLINYVSGVPILEKRADEKFGNQEAYWEYKRNTSSLIPLPRGILGDKNASMEAHQNKTSK